jgi:hypothetical protein
VPVEIHSDEEENEEISHDVCPLSLLSSSPLLIDFVGAPFAVRS